MGNYNADAVFDSAMNTCLLRADALERYARILGDQWTLDSAHRVSSFHDGTNKHKLQMSYDPREIL